MLRLVIDARMCHASGIGTYLRNLLPFFKASGLFSLELLKAKEEDLPEYPGVVTPYPLYSLKEQFCLPFHIKEADLFWSPHFNVPLLPIRAKKRIVTIHDVFHLSTYAKLKFYEKWYAKQLLTAAVSRSDSIVTISHFSKGEIVKHFPSAEKKLHPISLGVDFSFFSKLRSPSEEESVLKKYGMEGKKYILFVGNLKEHKNVETLIRAYQILKEKRGSAYHLVLIGKKFSHSLLVDSSVSFLEGVSNEELPIFYKRAAVFVFPSHYEGFGLPPLEAMSVGCPVVASCIPALQEVCGDAVHYIDPMRVESLVLGLESVLDDSALRSSLIEKGKARIEMFRWDKSARAHIELFTAQAAGVF